MVRAGEETGNMEDTLDRLALFFEKEHYTREKVKSAMTYPVVVGIIALVVVAYLMKFVVPRFETMFTQMGAELPVLTKIILSLSRSVENQWYIWLLVIVLIVAAYQLFKRTDKGAYAIDLMKLKIPVFGPLNQKGAIARMTRTLASLYASAVPVLQSLSIAEKVVGNLVISKYLRDSQDSLRRGRSLSEPLRKAWVFPPLVSQMIAIGEETGSLDEMLGKIADFYEKDVENMVDKLKALLEPLLIVFLAGVVGVIVAAIMLPMMQIYNNIH
jgi:type IV pilus assembly protein PilC